MTSQGDHAGDREPRHDTAPSANFDPARPDSGTRAMIIGDRPLPDEAHEAHDAHDPLPDPESPEVRIGPIVATGAGLLLLMVLGIVISLEMMRRWGAERVADEPAPRPQGIFREEDPQAPLLQVSSRQAMSEMRAREAKLLDSYGWVDRQRGIVHIPVEQAIDKYLVTAQAPAKDGAAPAGDAPPPAGTNPAGAPTDVPNGAAPTAPPNELNSANER